MNTATHFARQALVLATLALIFISRPSNESQAQDTPVKIGSFTRAASPSDRATKAFEQGVQLAIEKQTSNPVSVQFAEINQGNTPESAALKTLVETDQVPVVMYWSVADVSSVAPFLDQSSVVGLVAGDVTEEIPALGSYIFGFGFAIEKTFFEFAKFAGNKLKSYRVGMISSSAIPYDNQSKAFSEQWKSMGNTIVFDEKVDPGTPDFTALLAKAKKESCDTMFVTLPAAATVAFVKAARAAAFKGKILVGDSLYAEEVAQLGKDAEGIYLPQSWSEDAAFKSQYSAKFGQSPDGVTLGAAALGFDTIRCIQATKGPLSASAIKHSFLSEPCEGLTGKTQFTGERIAQRRKRALTIKDGQFVLAE